MDLSKNLFLQLDAVSISSTEPNYISDPSVGLFRIRHSAILIIIIIIIMKASKESEGYIVLVFQHSNLFQIVY